MSNLLTHAERELDILTATHKDPDNRPVVEPFRKEILALVEAFGNSGQSGGSAPISARVLSHSIEKLLLFTPIAPLTGEEEEWNQVGDDDYQNNRCSAVFKKANVGDPYYIDAVIFVGEDPGDQFTGKVEEVFSRQYIKEFPFTPKKFFIDVRREPFDLERHGKDARSVTCGTGDYVYFIKDREQLKEVFEYYNQYV